MTAVYVVRHPETTWNAAERYQGRLESPLSAKGKQQSGLVSAAFLDGHIDVVYSSPLQRALHMAREIAQTADAPLCIDHRLTEMAQGPWEGLYRQQIEARYPSMYHDWHARPDGVQFPYGEGLAEVQVRALSALDDICHQHEEGNVVICTHSVVVQALTASSLALELRYIHRIRVDNASITTICREDGQDRLLAANNTDPLYHSPLASAAAQNCVSLNRRRTNS